MGRPLNKKYFGNRNVGINGNQTGVNANSQNYADDRIGGESVAEIIADAIKGVALINSSYPAPALQKPAPTIPGGVQFTAQVIWEVDHIELVSGGSNYETTGFPINVTLTGLGGSVVGKMTANNAGVCTAAGINTNWDSPGANRGEFIDTPPTENLTYEVCTPVNISGGGDNAQCQVFFRVKRIEVLTPGSGYTGTETFSWATAGRSANPFPAPPALILTTDSGAPGSATNQENAIIIHANTSSGGTTAKVGDIIKQTATRNYKVKTADGIKVCKLGTTTTPAPKGAYIVATAEGGNTYYVTKLTAHRATLATKTGNGALNGKSAPWNFTSTANGHVVIENA